MCPVDETAEIVPLVHAAHINAITHAERHASGEIDIVRDQQRPATANIDDEALMTRDVVVVRQQSPDETGDLDPFTVVAPSESFIQSGALIIFLGQAPTSAKKKRGWPSLATTLPCSCRRSSWR